MRETEKDLRRPVIVGVYVKIEESEEEEEEVGYCKSYKSIAALSVVRKRAGSHPNFLWSSHP